MRILFLTQILPYPPNAGPRVKTWNVLRYLVRQGHEIHLASYIRPEEEPHLGAVLERCASVSTIPIRRSRLRDLLAWLRSHLSGRPFLVERDDTQAMTELVRRIVTSRKIDAIHADQLTMAQFALVSNGNPGANNHQPTLIFDAHNAVWTIVRGMRHQMPALIGPIIDLEARRIKAYEGHIVRVFDQTLAVSEPDRAALVEAGTSQNGENGTLVEKKALGSRISVIPIGVDVEKLGPVSRQADSRNILTLGTLHYPPNADGVRWFLKDVLPLVRDQVPESTLTIAGKNPPEDIQRLARNSNGATEVIGYVQDLTPYLEAAAVMVVPVRAGGGMRVRILEGFARGIPMVTTTLGLEGIGAKHTRDILVADTAAGFAQQVVRVLRNEQLQADLSDNGRKLIVEKYDWRTALESLNQIYADTPVEAYAI